MRLLIVGTLRGQLSTATKIAMDRGAAVTHAESIDQALAVLRSGKGADLLMVEVAVDIRALVEKLELEHIHVPIVACGIENNARAAAARSRADRGGAGRRRRRFPRTRLARRSDGAGDEACPADRDLRCVGTDH